jgi:hypothetical protein
LTNFLKKRQYDPYEKSDKKACSHALKGVATGVCALPPYQVRGGKFPCVAMHWITGAPGVNVKTGARLSGLKVCLTAN